VTKLDNWTGKVKDVDKNFLGGRATKKRPKISTISPLPGEGGNEKRPKNSTIKPLSAISVPCLKIQGARPPAPRFRRPSVR